jgi:exopolyphosphatase/guanosine-5'-triphosphate,3'-diphosphate pyrophosphatase
MNTVAAIDVGSNAIRLAIGTVGPEGKLTVLTNRRASVRLGRDVFRSGSLSTATQADALEAFIVFQRLLKEHKVSSYRAVATSALRDARNGASVVDRIKKKTGLQLETISGDEEARLIHLAVRSTVSLSQGTSLLMDIGGGSVEITLVHRGDVYFSDSVNMGTVRMLEMIRGKRLSPSVLKRLIRQYAKRIQRQVKRGLMRAAVTRMIGTGGNLDTLGELRKKLLKKKDSSFIKREELERLYDKLSAMSLEERITKLELRPDRADVIIPAMALILGVMEQAKVKTLMMPRVGLREGILLDLGNRGARSKAKRSFTTYAKQVVSVAKEIGRRFSFDEAHAEHARRLALQIFEQTRPVHKCHEEVRLLLEVAALLHDVGDYINSNDHHKHSAYIVRESHFVGLDDVQRNIVAAAVRYHRGTLPAPDHIEWKAVRSKDRGVVKLLAGILRIVEQLDREHLARISRISIQSRGKLLILQLPKSTPLLVERWGCEKAMGLLETALNRQIIIKPRDTRR